MSTCALVILAAGIGSRFGGGVKQLEPVGPAGEIIMDYTIRDAIDAGFGKIVFLIRKDIKQDFQAVIGDRIEAYCGRRGVQVAYAYQEIDELPAGFTCPEGRTRPWGTGQALLACKEVVHEPFVVCNADDYYGRTCFTKLLDYLRKEGGWCLAGFRLGNTLSGFGGVTRGLCRMDAEGKLLAVKETRNIQKSDLGVSLDPKVCVSMNMWGFTTDIFDHLQERFVAFLREFGQDLNKEFLLPELVDDLLREGKATVQVLPTADQWYGMTYREDIPIVKEAFQHMQ